MTNEVIKHSDDKLRQMKSVSGKRVVESSLPARESDSFSHLNLFLRSR